MTRVPGRVLRVAGAVGERVSEVAVWAIVALVFLQVVFRYLLGIGLSWPDEMARYLHIVIVFLCLGQVTRDGRHIRIDILSRRFGGAVGVALQRFALFFGAVVLAVGAGHIMLRIGGLRTPAAGMPIFLFFLPVVLGFGMVALEAARQVLAGSAAAGGDGPSGPAREAVPGGDAP